MRVPKALTIAGSDSGGGAGIQADLKTFSAFRVFGMSVLTAVTAQNSVGVTGVHDLPPEFVGQQIDAVLGDFGADAVKLGMLSNAGIIRAVAARLTAHGQTRIVLDPVMIAKSGAPLLESGRRPRGSSRPRAPPSSRPCSLWPRSSHRTCTRPRCSPTCRSPARARWKR